MAKALNIILTRDLQFEITNRIILFQITKIIIILHLKRKKKMTDEKTIFDPSLTKLDFKCKIFSAKFTWMFIMEP